MVDDLRQAFDANESQRRVGGVDARDAADRPPAGRASTRARRDDRRFRRVAAVVDKDHAAVVLAEAVDADALLLLTDVAAVHPGWVPRIGFRSCT